MRNAMRALIASVVLCVIAVPATAQKKYDPGATANLKNFELDMLLPGIKVNTGPIDYFPLEELQMRRFSGERWESFGPIISGEIGS